MFPQICSSNLVYVLFLWLYQLIKTIWKLIFARSVYAACYGLYHTQILNSKTKWFLNQDSIPQRRTKILLLIMNDLGLEEGQKRRLCTLWIMSNTINCLRCRYCWNRLYSYTIGFDWVIRLIYPLANTPKYICLYQGGPALFSWIYIGFNRHHHSLETIRSLFLIKYAIVSFWLDLLRDT